ncbi:cyclophilin-like fold protein [Paenibacillus riograndensis]|uniref:Cyclophilin-like domain-containing protein n=1 Tax=Paenibacillus riograndensis SBR5 TaxID=1073571 RepID=A0A0E4HAF6_9BACL|nr:cyclophilin-like fold protein [Paenibacillus riograndensis]CQR55912.1 hypothetical protein PRIO_3509 [Paenibacillus riograndensis SBR5]
MKINPQTLRLRINDKQIVVSLCDYPISKDFLSLLPLTASFEDYVGKEKISYLPRKLNIDAAPSDCGPVVGDVAY